ncbi:MAG: NUDIX hydrolase [Maribacter sp.]|nr:NUDIX hydrolase [Maribacter sp.]
MDQNLIDFTTQVVDECLPGKSIDCVIIGFEKQQLKVLLLKWKYEDIWCLPGGFIRKDEDMDQAAQRILEMRTGLKSVYLNQFYTFGSKKRSRLNEEVQLTRMRHVLEEIHGKNEKFVTWITQRFITTGYFALVDIRKTAPHPDMLSDRCEWKSLSNIPGLMMDHKEIILKVMEHLRVQLNYLPIGISLLPQKFTMQDLQKLYEAILKKPLERSNFQRKMLKLGFFIRHEKQLTGAANKAPYLYSFDEMKYNELIEKGIGFRY